ncbi:MAG: hypothetical protein ACRDGT_00515 [Candidatus Limnocylindria bacterium]
MSPLPIHAQLATALILYLAALGVWGTALGLGGSGPTASYRGSLVIAEAVVVLQGLLGAAAWLSTGPSDAIHVLYGLALVVTIPLVATVVREGSPRRTSLSLGLASFFAAGLAIRGMTTG